MKKTPPLHVEEISGDRYADLKTAQAKALPQLADSFQSVIRDLIARGILINDNGKITPKPQG
jgi:hypothetical protein